MKQKKIEKPAMLSWGSEERERLSLVTAGIRRSAKAANAPAGLSELSELVATCKKLSDAVQSGAWETMSRAGREAFHEGCFGMLREDTYRTSILNPDVSAKTYGNAYAQVISALGAELQETIPYLMRGIRKPFLYACELIAEVFGHIEKDGVDRGIKQSLYYYVHDYFREYSELRVYDRYNEAAAKQLEETCTTSDSRLRTERCRFTAIWQSSRRRPST